MTWLAALEWVAVLARVESCHDEPRRLMTHVLERLGVMGAPGSTPIDHRLAVPINSLLKNAHPGFFSVERFRHMSGSAPR
ncbi:MAG: hypothetical protein Q8J78_16185 [Moraxellaceae bacterium]|nr:hypothetical protein [Moraxellaceae bacterium]